MMLSEPKHLIRRYLLATLVGVVVGLVGVSTRYWYYMEKVVGDSPAQVDRYIMSRAEYVNSGRLGERRVFQQLWYICGLLYYCEDQANLLGNIFLGSILLVPFAVHTFDVVAASRGKAKQGAA
jgi:hypothetical protein